MKQRSTTSRLRYLASLFSTALAVGMTSGPRQVLAQATWDAGGAATNLNWGTAANWNPDGVPTNTAAVTFGATGSAASAATVTSIVEASRTISSLSFNQIDAAQFHRVQINASQTLTINGTGSLKVGSSASNALMNTSVAFSGPGALNVSNTDGNMEIGLAFGTINSGSNHSASLDLSGLGSFTANVGDLRIGYGSLTAGTLTLSNTTNSITANTIHLGNSATANTANNAGVSVVSLLNLGTGTNTIRTNTLNIGTSKASGTLIAPTAGGTLTLGGKTGATTNITIGSTAGTGGTTATPTGIMDLRGVTANVTAGALVLGRRDGTSSTTNNGAGGASGTLYFSAGTFTANSVELGRKTNTTTSASVGLASGRIFISGGTFIVNAGGSFSLGYQEGKGSSEGILELTGGTLISNTDIIDGGGNTATTINLFGGTLDMMGFAIGDGTNKINTLDFRTGTLRNIGQINGGDALIKNTAGVLTLEGVNSYTGGTNISVGTLAVGAGSISGNLGSGSVTVESTGVLSFNRRDTYDLANIITGTGGTIQQDGLGNTRLLSVNTTSNASYVANQGILTAVNLNALGSAANVNVASSGKFYFMTDGLTPATMAAASTITVANGGTLGVAFGDTMTTGSLVGAAAGTIYFDVHSRAGLAPDGTYTIFTSTANLPGGVNYDIRFYGLTNSIVASSPVIGTNSITVTMAALPPEVLAQLPEVLYWKGGYVGAESVWAVSNGVLDQSLARSNWAVVRNGDVLYPLAPVGSMDVIFSVDSANAAYMANTSLGADVAVKTLSVDGQGSGSAATAAVAVNDGVYKLTITGGDSTSTVRTPSIYVASNTGGLTLNVDVALSATLPLLTVGMTDGSQLGVGALTMSGVVSGNAFTKRGAGSLTLSGLEANTMTGVTRIEQGTTVLAKTAGLNAITGSELYIGEQTLSATGLFAIVSLGAAEQIADAVDVTIYTGSTLNINGNNETIGALNGTGTVTSNGTTTGILTVGTGDKSSTFSGVISSTTALTKVGTGTLTLGSATANGYTGATNILGGTILYANNNALGAGAVTVSGVSTVWNMNGFSDSVGAVTLSDGAQITGEGSTLTATGTYTVQNGVISVNLAGAVGLNKNGDGLVILSGNNTFTGAVTVGGSAASILRITSSTALGTGSTTTINGDASNLATLEVAGDILVNENVVLAARQGASANAAAIRNHSGNNVWAGSITFTTGGSNYNIESQSGTLTITGQISGGTTTGAGRFLQLYGDSDGVVSGAIINGPGTGGVPPSVNVLKTGTGTWTLSGINSYTGTTAVNGGTLRVTNSSGLGATSSLSVATGAAFQYSPGATNSNITVGSLNLATGSTIGVGLGSAIVSTGAATTAGTITLDVIGISGATYTNSTYNVITAASGLDTGTYTLGKLYNLTNFRVNSIGKTATSVFLDVSAEEELATAWWKGGFSASDGNVWAITDGSTKSNWASDAAGTNTSLTPGASTNLIFSAAGAVQQADPMTLGVSMSVASLTVNSPSAVWLQDVANSLTFTGTNAITVNAGAGAVTLDASVFFSNAAPVVNVAGSSGGLLLSRVRGNAFTKTGTGALTLNGSLANDYAGTFKAYEGLVTLDKPTNVAAITGNLEVGDSGGSTATVRLAAAEQIVNTADVTVNSGGTLDLNGFNESIDGLNGSGIVITSSANATLTLGAANEAAAVFNGSLRNGAGVLSVVKTGTGTQTLGGQSAYSGSTAINQGTLRVTTTGALGTGALTLGTGSNAGRLEVAGGIQTVRSIAFNSNNVAAINEVVISSGARLTVAGTATGTNAMTVGFASSGAQTTARFSGGGALVINNAVSNNNDIIIGSGSGGSPVATLDMSGLARFDATVRNFDVINYASGTFPKFNIILAKDTQITAARFVVSSTDGSPPQTGNTFLLGQNTVFNADTIMLGAGRASFNLDMNTGLTGTPTFKIRATNGTGRATLVLGNNSGLYGGRIGGSSNPTVAANMNGTRLDWLVSDLVLGVSQSVASNLLGHGIGIVNFDTGRIDATNVYLGLGLDVASAGTDPNDGTETHGTINMGGGTFVAANLSIAENRDGSGGVNGFIRGQMNISGGTAHVTGNITMGSHTSTSTGESIAGLSLTGGTLTVDGNLQEGAGTVTLNKSTVTLDGGTLDMTVGTINVDTFNAVSGTLKNVAQINADGALAALNKTGAGKTLNLTGTNAYTGATTVSGGTLWARSSTALQGTASLTVNTGAAFRYTAGATGNNLTLKSGAGFTLQNGSTLGVELGNQIIVQGAATTTGATVTVDVFGVAGATYAAGTHTVVSAASGLNGGSYVLGNFYNLSGFTVTGVGSNATSVWLNVAAATALTDAYWKGGYAGGANVWAISNGSTASNWTTDSAGTGTTGQVAGASTKVIFSATGASNQTDMRLGADMAVGSLEFNNTTAVALNDLDNKLKVNAANAITVNGTGAVTLNTQLTLADSQAVVNVADAAGVLNLQGSVTGNGLTKTGTGRLNMEGTNTFSGAMALNAGTTYLNGVTTMNSLNVAAAARLEASGNITSTNAMSISGTLAVGNESLATPVISNLSLTAGTGGVTFQNGSVLTFDLFTGAGAGGGQSDMLAITGTLTIGSNVSLQVDTNGMTTWAAGDSWKLFDWTGLTSVSGSFVTADLDAVLNGTGLNWDYSALYTSGIITVAVPEPSRALLMLAAMLALGCRRRRR
ncbi:autotransporter-associated beta strand repeat-containing protein [Verrucomicrobium sp. BvORR034]|uniref:beta strand repeat-containing protein n=1 Tax=Verrucomicrobium sp. BvORR034 TaxID=1396418 RepID=UPI000678EBBC|nr:autotransporter-associated beta strand repeat-containing protein [Verrucomicrobium sp. BvORR034]